MLDFVKAAERRHLRVYFAGKVNTENGLSDWREWFFVKDTTSGTVHALGDGTLEYVYAGPSIQWRENDKHQSGPIHGTEHDKHDMCQQTFWMCVRELDQADVVVALVDEGCYGTMWELGYSYAKGIPTLACVVHRDCWFADPHGADYTSGEHRDVSLEILRSDLASAIVRHKCLHEIVTKCQSPLEQSVGRAWMAKRDTDVLLWPQVQEGHYRIDFASPSLRLAIELDGFTYHSSREQFAKDRERERYLIERGWKVIRFHGDEIRNNLPKVINEIERHIELRAKELEGA